MTTLSAVEPVCDNCDAPPVVTIPTLGNLCRGCLAASAGDPEPGSGGHYTLEHATPVCFAAPSDRAAVDRLVEFCSTLPATPTLRSSLMLLARGRAEDGDTDLLDHGGTLVTTDDVDGYVLLSRCWCAL